VGVKNRSHECFKNMNLDEILTKDLISICRTERIKYKLLRELKDIDTPSDLLNL